MNVPDGVRAQLGLARPKPGPPARPAGARAHPAVARLAAFLGTSYGQRLIIWTVGPLFFLFVHLSIKHFHPPHPPISFQADVRRTEANLRVLHTALDLFRVDCGRYPTTAETLTALVRSRGIRGWKGPYIQALYMDPWLHPYQYGCTNDVVALSSMGPDGQPNTPDDLQAPAPDQDAPARSVRISSEDPQTK
jgi:type II secretion system protein G